MTEQHAADRFIYDHIAAPILTAGGGLVSPDRPQEGSEPPYTIYSSSVGTDTDTNGDVRIITAIDYTIRTITADDKDIADACALAIDTALDGLSVQVYGFQINCKRSGPLSNASSQSGKNYRYGGGRYRVTVRQLLAQ